MAVTDQVKKERELEVEMEARLESKLQRLLAMREQQREMMRARLYVEEEVRKRPAIGRRRARGGLFCCPMPLRLCQKMLDFALSLSLDSSLAVLQPCSRCDQ